MSHKLIVVLLAGVFFLAACITPAGSGGPTQPPVTAVPLPATSTPAEPAVTIGPETPVTNPGSDGTPTSAEDWRPQPGDEKLQRGQVFIEESGILTLESFPPQFVLHLSGSQGDPCRRLRAVISAPDAQNRIQVEVYSVYDPAELCAQVIKAFDLNLPLGSLPQGEYTVLVNGGEVGKITAP